MLLSLPPIRSTTDFELLLSARKLDLRLNATRLPHQCNAHPLYPTTTPTHLVVVAAVMPDSSNGPPPIPYVQSGDLLSDFLRSFWQRQVDAAENEAPDFRHPPLPLARIKKVMKSDPEVKVSHTVCSSERDIDGLSEGFVSCACVVDDLCGRSVLCSFPSFRCHAHNISSAPILFCKACESELSFLLPDASANRSPCLSFHSRDNSSRVHRRRLEQAAHPLPVRHRQGALQVRPVRLLDRHYPPRGWPAWCKAASPCCEWYERCGYWEHTVDFGD